MLGSRICLLERVDECQPWGEGFKEGMMLWGCWTRSVGGWKGGRCIPRYRVA